MASKTAGDVTDLSLTPDVTWLARPDVTFPVTIDPSAATIGDEFEGFVQTDYSQPQSGATELKLGTSNGGGLKARSFLRWDLSPFYNTHINWATLSLWEFHSFSCRAGEWQMWRTGYADYQTTWANQPPWLQYYVSSTQTKGYNSGCGAGWVDIDAKQWLQDGVTSRYEYYTMGLRAHDETNNDEWKRFNSSEAASDIPYLTFGFSWPPSVTAVSMAPSTSGGCAVGSGRPFVTSTTPQLAAQVSEAEGLPSTVNFEWSVASTGAFIGSAQLSNVPSGTTATATIPSGAFTDGGTYSWRVKATGPSGATLDWAATCEFTVDAGPPGVPFVSSPQYPENGRGTASSGQFTFTPATGDSDVVAFTYQLDTDTSATTVSGTGATAVTITPSAEGHRILTVRAKDRAGNLSDPKAYPFEVGRAGIAQPLPGANVVSRMKLSVDIADSSLTQVQFRYRRGPGGAEYDIPLANLINAQGQPVTSGPVRLADLGGYAIWNAVDTLGSVGGVVQVSAKLFTDAVGDPGYQTAWVTANLDPNGDGAAGTGVGPGSANLLTGDYTLSSTDTDELGLSVDRVASSREPADGWVPQGERLTANQQQISTDTSGFWDYLTNAVIARSTVRGQGPSTDALSVTPTATDVSGGGAHSYVALDGDYGHWSAGMKAGHTYRITGWIYVPSGTGLTPDEPTYGLRIGAFAISDSSWVAIQTSPKAAWTDGWQQLSVDLAVPANATAAWVRLYNGFAPGSGKQVFWDNISVKEIVAPFGPQWRGGPTDAAAGSSYASLQFPQPDLAQILTAAGGSLTFAKNSANQFFPQPGAEDLTLAVGQAANTYTLTDLDGTVTTFALQGGAYPVVSTSTPDQHSTTSYVYDSTDNRTLVKRVINPAGAGIGNCTTATPARGCEVLEYDYAPATTATAATFGDYLDQVRSVKVWTWDPAASAETAVEVTHYAYDTTGALREVWDPRVSPALKTSYEYDPAGRVTKATPAGQLPWMFDYDTVGGDDNAGRLMRVRRAALQQGSATTTDGENATNLVYHVPLTTTGGGPYNLDYPTISKWDQKDLPTDATAVFGPQDPPTVNDATATTPGAGGYPYATVHYLNASGQEVNTATPGGHIDTSEYDRYGNVVRTLEATNREMALGTLPGAASYASQLGLPADSVGRAQLLSTYKTYSADGLDLIDTLGPVARIALEHDLADPTGDKPTLPARTQVIARPHTVTVYDEGKPTGQTYHLETTDTSGAAVPGYPDADVRVTHTGYGAEKGGTSGWTLKKATSTTTDAGTAYVVYDNDGRPTQSWGIGATGIDARTTITIYYTAGTNSADAACGSKPEWDGQPCVTKAGGPITGQRADMTSDLPVKRVESYTRYGDANQVAETANGKVRRTTTVYDTAERVTSVSITSDEGVGMPAVTTDYDPATGMATVTHMGTASITRVYDALGRLFTYTDADGGTTHNEYDHYGRAAKVADNTGTATFTYDRAIEPRGMLTSVTDSIAGTFTARYSPDGQIIQQTYPGGVTRTDTLDASLTPVQRVYSRDTDGATLYAESVVRNTQGQVITDVYTGGSKTNSYDQLGRLTTTQQVDAANACTTRAYAYDTRTNRQARKTYHPAADGSCRSDTADAEDDHTYDTADRLTDAGYTYDSFGRVVGTPAGLVNTFYANDLVATQTLGSTRQSWTLDPAHRFRGFTTDTLVGGNWTNASSKLNHYGDDSDEPRWTVEDTTLGSVTRNVSGPDADLAATTSSTGNTALQLTDLHGSVAMTIDTALTTPQLLTFDEFGIPATGQDQTRYGWLGGKQRSADALGGVILMGVRLYSPDLGRFLQTDPTPAGNSTAYDYCSGDPVNCTDLDGNWGWSSLKKALKTVATVASYASVIPGPIGTIAGVVSAVAYVATGNWKQAAWAAGGALAATVGAGAAVKVAALSVTAVKGAKLAAVAVGAASTAKKLRGGENIAASVGRLAHSRFVDALASRGYLAATKLASGRLPDALTRTGLPVELKSTSKWAIRRGTSQLRRYMKEMGTTSGELWTYTRRADGDFNYQLHSIVHLV